MPAGKATGVNREYEVLCRDILIARIGQLLKPLRPYRGDGIDVELRVGSAKVHFDVALVSDAGDLVVAECKRNAKAVKQGMIATFAWEAEQLRQFTGHNVAAFFFTTRGYQIGAVQMAFDPGIRIAVVESEADVDNVVFAFHRYDPDRDRRLHEWQVAFTAVAPPPTATLDFVVRDRDGNIKQIGRA